MDLQMTIMFNEENSIHGTQYSFYIVIFQLIHI